MPDGDTTDSEVVTAPVLRIIFLINLPFLSATSTYVMSDEMIGTPGKLKRAAAPVPSNAPLKPSVLPAISDEIDSPPAGRVIFLILFPPVSEITANVSSAGRGWQAYRAYNIDYRAALSSLLITLSLF